MENDVFTEHSTGQPRLVKTVTNWAPARSLFREFVDAHPELGMEFSEGCYANFTRVHGPGLMRNGVMRKSYLRAPYLGDVNRFDEAVFDLLTGCRFVEATQND